MNSLKIKLVFLISLSLFVHSVNASNVTSTSPSSEDYSLKFFFKWLFGGEAQAQTYQLIYFWKSTYVLDEEEFVDRYNAKLGYKERIKFKIDEKSYYLGVFNIKSGSAKIILGPGNQTLLIGDSRKIDINSDGYFDVFLTLNSVSGFFKKADITIYKIHEKINQDSLILEKEKEKRAISEFGNSRDSFDFKEVDWWIWLVLVLILLLFVILIIVYFSIKK